MGRPQLAGAGELLGQVHPDGTRFEVTSPTLFGAVVRAPVRAAALRVRRIRITAVAGRVVSLRVGEAVVDAHVVQRHQRKDDPHRVGERRVQRPPENAPAHTEDAERALDHNARIRLPIVERVFVGGQRRTGPRCDQIGMGAVCGVTGEPVATWDLVVVQHGPERGHRERRAVVRRARRLHGRPKEAAVRVTAGLQVHRVKALAVVVVPRLAARLLIGGLADLDGHAVECTNAPTHDAAAAPRKIQLGRVERCSVGEVERAERESQVDGTDDVVRNRPDTRFRDVTEVCDSGSVAASEQTQRRGDAPLRRDARARAVASLDRISVDVASHSSQNCIEAPARDAETLTKLFVGPCCRPLIQVVARSDLVLSPLTADQSLPIAEKKLREEQDEEDGAERNSRASRAQALSRATSSVSGLGHPLCPRQFSGRKRGGAAGASRRRAAPHNHM
mmetsp:Transcript_4870/g.17387  ORF Transcript_4870/g.17387 Transcript_4870/m.17387 type:complete len:448 (-) Transcript_4870:34-1377(-)